MRKLLIALAILVSGCRGGPGDYVVTGSAYVESERPEGRAVAKVEVQYRPPAEKRIAIPTSAPTGASLGDPEPVK
jgi:hypothetical protein